MGRNYSATAVDTTLSSAISSTATSFSVMATVGFPSAPFVLALIDSPGAQEVVLVTGVVGTTLTVTRGYDDTTAAAHPATAVVRHVASAIDFREAANHIDAVSGVHGVGAGAVVGTSTAQTLTNKNLTSGTNTFPTFITGFLVPTGAGFEWHSTAAAPSGFLMQDGGEYLISSFTALYNHLTTNGTVFPHGANTNGSGAAGSTHFRTPNRKGKVAVGFNAAETEFNAIGKTGGFKTHTLTSNEMPVHTHTQNAHSHAQDAHSHSASSGATNAKNWDYGTVPTAFYDGDNWAVVNGAGGYHQRVMVWTNSPAYETHSHSVSIANANPGIYNNTATNNNTGGGAAHNILQPYTVMNYIIKT